ncbi:endogenous retrovirus group K member 25 Pro protein-like [Dasypus novemcinctus]|uniref:endogenous retrovirus group K member 25 Pro protein-like n=1 Tax=Dasypus novemcinctus TaxID=9361 RepID=UPI0026602287|nr:endogenous retrovirus group K member 25 Pro protein-like [Dasypus novemcinctus]
MWTLPISKDRPSLALRIDGHWFRGTLDSGAEVSCFPIYYERYWNLVEGPPVQGATGAASSQQVRDPLTWEDEEGHMGSFRPLVLPNLPTILWGRDVLSQSGAFIATASPQ